MQSIIGMILTLSMLFMMMLIKCKEGNESKNDGNNDNNLMTMIYYDYEHIYKSMMVILLIRRETRNCKKDGECVDLNHQYKCT